MERAFEFVTVTPGSRAFDDAERINREAFPPTDLTPMEKLVALREKAPGSKVVAVYECGTCVGFYHVIEVETFVYGAFFAVCADKRGQGYGSRILKAILANCNGKPLVCDVEYPFEDADNYEQRVNRIRFYERNGMVNTGEVLEAAGHGTYYVFSSVPNPPLREYLAVLGQFCEVSLHSL